MIFGICSKHTPDPIWGLFRREYLIEKNGEDLDIVETVENLWVVDAGAISVDGERISGGDGKVEVGGVSLLSLISLCRREGRSHYITEGGVSKQIR